VKPCEDVRQFVGGNALPRVPHRQLHIVLPPVQAELDDASGRRELDGVGEQVEDDLREARGIALDRHGLARHGHRQTELFDRHRVMH
jgi:hypothetical protein